MGFLFYFLLLSSFFLHLIYICTPIHHAGLRVVVDEFTATLQWDYGSWFIRWISVSVSPVFLFFLLSLRYGVKRWPDVWTQDDKLCVMEETPGRITFLFQNECHISHIIQTARNERESASGCMTYEVKSTSSLLQVLPVCLLFAGASHVQRPPDSQGAGYAHRHQTCYA